MRFRTPKRFCLIELLDPMTDALDMTIQCPCREDIPIGKEIVLQAMRTVKNPGVEIPLNTVYRIVERRIVNGQTIYRCRLKPND